MESLRSCLDHISEKIRPLENSRNFYSEPFPKGTRVERIVIDSPAHHGAYRGAIDFVIDSGTEVLCPYAGRVIKVVDSNDKYGPTSEFKECLNLITIQHPNGEQSQVAHLAQGSALAKEGDWVIEGQPLAKTGNSGHMTEPHLHFFVFKGTAKPPGFVGLRIRFKSLN